MFQIICEYYCTNVKQVSIRACVCVYVAVPYFGLYNLVFISLAV